MNRSCARPRRKNSRSARHKLPADEIERAVLLKMIEFSDVVESAFTQRMPHHLCEYAYTLATAFNRFYHEHYILVEEDQAQRSSWLALAQITVEMLERTLDLLGIEVPERM
ncbi:MAG: DALR anticodon-binding domain-containing protein [Caldilineaceae bacterium]